MACIADVKRVMNVLTVDASAAVQLKVICMLRHQEIGNLFSVCKELRATVSSIACRHCCWVTMLDSICAVHHAGIHTR